MRNNCCNNELDFSRYVDSANRILSKVRELEYELYDIYSDNEIIEDDIIEIKQRIKALKMDLCAIEDVRQMECR